jgi:aryl-alcohol dehydrogenase-like predicted oxidoreductase
MAMQVRRLGPFEVEVIGLGCMNLSHAYGSPPPRADAERLLLKAFDLGVRHFDTAALYGFGANEELVGPTLKKHRNEIVLASKCGMQGVDGKRVIDGRPATIKQTCEDSLRRLQTEVIDLYYLHRWDKRVPIEDSVGALKDLLDAGKIRAIGLSEVSAATLRKAAKVAPISAVQTEYSLWTRNPELGVLEACEEMGTAFVAFSPLARGFVCGAVRDPSDLQDKDIRRSMPRFQSPHWETNAARLDLWFELIESQGGGPPSVLALNWVLSRGPHVHVIPGTTSLKHLEENIGAAAFDFPLELLRRVERIFDRHAISGPRYAQAIQAEVDTEEFR